MTTVINSFSHAATSLFGGIASITSATAVAITDTVEGASTGATTFKRLMLDMDTDHADRSVIHRATYRSRLIIETAISNSNLKLDTDRLLAKDPELHNIFNDQLKELSAIFAPKAP